MPSLLPLTTPPQRMGPRAFRSTRTGDAFVAGAPNRDMVIEVNLSNLTAAAGEECGFSYRRLTSGLDFWAVYVDTGDNLLHLSRFAGTTEYSMATAAWTYSATAELRGIVQAKRHRVWVDGVQRIDFTDDGALNDGKGAGMFSRNATAVLFDELYAEGLS